MKSCKEAKYSAAGEEMEIKVLTASFFGCGVGRRFGLHHPIQSDDQPRTPKKLAVKQ
jgi:hypothetical protein